MQYWVSRFSMIPTQISNTFQIILFGFREKKKKKKRSNQGLWCWAVSSLLRESINVIWSTYTMIKTQRLKTSCGEFNNDLVKYNSSTLLLKAIGIRNRRSKKKIERTIYTNPTRVNPMTITSVWNTVIYLVSVSQMCNRRTKGIGRGLHQWIWLLFAWTNRKGVIYSNHMVNNNDIF